MKLRSQILIATLCLTTAAAFAQRSRRDGSSAGPTTSPVGAAPATAPRDDFASQFGVLADRNIFVKSRTPPVRRDDRPAPSTQQARVPTAEESLVLRGVVIEDDAGGTSVLRAYFEDQRTRTLIRVTAGDPLAKGHVADVSIDAIAFENQGAILWIRIGDNLLGERSSQGAAGSGAATTTSPSDDTGTSSAPLSDVERRMRERRQRNQ